MHEGMHKGMSSDVVGLYVVRELMGKRVWFAEPLLSSATQEVRRRQ